MVAEALPGEAADLQVGLGQGGVTLQKFLGEVDVNQVDKFQIVVPFRFLKVEINSAHRDLLRKRQGGHKDLILLQGHFQLPLAFLVHQFIFQGFLPQQQERQHQSHNQNAYNQIEIKCLQLLIGLQDIFLHLQFIVLLNALHGLVMLLPVSLHHVFVVKPEALQGFLILALQLINQVQALVSRHPDACFRALGRKPQVFDGQTIFFNVIIGHA